MNQLIWVNNTPYLVDDPRCTKQHLLLLYRDKPDLLVDIDSEGPLLKSAIEGLLASNRLKGMPAQRLFWQTRIAPATISRDRVDLMLKGMMWIYKPTHERTKLEMLSGWPIELQMGTQF
jgi:hypothetical protein